MDLLYKRLIVQLDPHGFHAAGGAANKVNHANGETTVAAFGFEAVLT